MFRIEIYCTGYICDSIGYLIKVVLFVLVLYCFSVLADQLWLQKGIRTKMGGKMTKVIPHLYIGGNENARDEGELIANCITHILTVQSTEAEINKVRLQLMLVLLQKHNPSELLNLSLPFRFLSIYTLSYFAVFVFHVLSITKSPKHRQLVLFQLSKYEYLKVFVGKPASKGLLRVIPQTNDFIHSARMDSGNVLVHRYV